MGNASPHLCPLPLWESLTREDTTSTFFDSPLWHSLAAAHFNRSRATEMAPLLFNFTRAGEQSFSACLPLLRDRRWGRDRYFSPFGTYGALLCTRELNASERAKVEDRLATLNIQVAGSPFARNPFGSSDPSTLTRSTIQLIDLTPDHTQSPARDWDPDPRRRLRIARENNVTVRAARPDNNWIQDWDNYYGLYLKSLQRWGAKATSGYPRPLFDAIRDAAASKDNESDGGKKIQLWLAEYEGKPVAGYIAFYHNTHACIWHGAADQEYFKLGAVQMLSHDMIADAAQRGFAVFDFMGSAGLKALEAFKASLGARTVSYDGYLNRSGLTGKLIGKISALRNRIRQSAGKK